METVGMTTTQSEALKRLLAVALSDTGQSRRVANFLLAWWNAESCGGFDLTDAWGVDTSIAVDMVEVFNLAIARNVYPDGYGFADEFNSLVRIWRPQLL